MLENLYLVVMIVGFGYLLLTFLLGQVGDLIDTFSGGDLVGDHPDTGALDHPHGGLGHDAGHISPINPLTVAAFLTLFGAAGLSTSYQGYTPGLTLAISLVVSLAAGVLVWSVLVIIARNAGSASVSERTLVGLQGDVLLTIPVGGHGEVRLVVNDQIVAFPARSAEGEIPTGDRVHVLQAEAGILTVSKGSNF
jgi:membrane protein implicated in regulation of membrane protease activity